MDIDKAIDFWSMRPMKQGLLWQGCNGVQIWLSWKPVRF